MKVGILTFRATTNFLFLNQIFRLFSTLYANPPHGMPKILALQEF